MNKFNKGKIIGIACASLAAVSLVGVGFSSWVISTRNPVSTGNVTVNVAETFDKRIVIDEVRVSDPNIKFDCKKGDSVGDIQYTGDDNGGEDLSFTITYNVTLLGANLTDGEYQGIKAYYSMIDESEINKKFTALIGKNYFTMPISNSEDSATQIADGTKVQPEGDKNVTTTPNVTTKINKVTNNVISYTSTFDLSWGSFFKNTNPGACLELAEHGDLTVDTILTALGELYKASSAKFIVTLAPIISK